MVQRQVTPIRRAPRQGRPDGTSETGRYVARWTDEDTGTHVAEIEATSEQAVRDTLEPYVGSNSLTIRKVSG